MSERISLRDCIEKFSAKDIACSIHYPDEGIKVVLNDGRVILELCKMSGFGGSDVTPPDLDAYVAIFLCDDEADAERTKREWRRDE